MHAAQVSSESQAVCWKLHVVPPGGGVSRRRGGDGRRRQSHGVATDFTGVDGRRFLRGDLLAFAFAETAGFPARRLLRFFSSVSTYV